MRPVPSRTRIGVEAIPATLTSWLTGSSFPELRTTLDPILTNQPELIDQAASYADLIWIAVKILREGAAEANKSPTTPASPQMGQPIYDAAESAVLKLLRNFSPGTERVARMTRLNPAYPDRTVSYNALNGLTSGEGTGAFLGTAMGARAPKARALAERLKRRVDGLGQLLGLYTETGAAGTNVAYATAPFTPDETFASVSKQWVEEARRAAQTRAATAPPATPALTMSLPTSNYPSGTMTAQAGPSGAFVSMQDGAATGGQPAWLLPALVGTAVAGVALLLLPDGSGNRGSRARNLDYGRVASDAQEGRMLRNTLRNLETDAHAMRQMLEDDDDLPQWVHAKVQTSADRVNAAHRYLRAKIQRG
jgi:hypothetical protein